MSSDVIFVQQTTHLFNTPPLLLLIVIIQSTMYPSTQSDFFDEHLSDVLRDIVEIENYDRSNNDFHNGE